MRQLPLLEGWRFEQFGKDALDLVEGKLAFAVVNGNYAISSGIKLTEAIYQEKSYAYVNWGVVKSADVAKPWAKDVVAAYNSNEFKAWAKKKFVGYKFPQAWK